MVRVRIGDLITTNYSKFNLARVFGYTYKDTKFGGESLPEEKEKFDALKYLSEIEKLKNTPNNYFTTAAPLSNPRTKNSDALKKNKKKPATNIVLPSGLALLVKEGNLPEGKVVCEVRQRVNIDKKGFSDFDLLSIGEFYSETGAGPYILGQEYIFDASDLEPLPSTAKKARSTATGGYTDKVSAYMDEENGNVISKSFRSVGGKGLAGFIESLSFDWYEGITWTTDEGIGRKAPKMCKVTVAFSPIHDITPGLDHVGANRAPIYTVKNRA